MLKILRRSSSMKNGVGLEKLLARADQTQKGLLEEACILVDQNDCQIGQISKLGAHVLENGTSPLHRAFSLFHFNNQNELLMQKRSIHKITFPSLWTNTVCSHPLATSSERDGAKGVMNAVRRRSLYEFNLDLAQTDLLVVKRILYSAPMDHALLAEHELDYCVVSQGDLAFSMNENEIDEFVFIAQNQLDQFMAQNDTTPWFRLIYQSGLLTQWWAELEKNGFKSITVDDSIRVLN